MKYEEIIEGLEAQYKCVGKELIEAALDYPEGCAKLQEISINLLKARTALLNDNVRESEMIIWEIYKLDNDKLYQRILYRLNREETGSDYGPQPLPLRLEVMGSLGAAFGNAICRMLDSYGKTN